jgi:ribosomal protein S18 acetylase RimI-like enzyme
VNGFSIQPATEADREWCARVMAATDPWVTLGRGYEQCLARCRQAELIALVARLNETPLGFILLHPTGLAGSPYVASIATAAEARGQGVGSALLEAAEAWFPNARHIFLCVSSFNARARRLYERRGYAMVGELMDYVIQGASEILMHKNLVRP